MRIWNCHEKAIDPLFQSPNCALNRNPFVVSRTSALSVGMNVRKANARPSSAASFGRSAPAARFAIIPSPVHVSAPRRTSRSSVISMRAVMVSVAVKNMAFAVAVARRASARGLSAVSAILTLSASAPCFSAALRTKTSSAFSSSAVVTEISSVPFPLRIKAGADEKTASSA